MTDLIRKLYKKADFKSANYDGTLNAKGRPITAKHALHGVWAVYPQYKEIVGLHDVYAAIADLLEEDRASVLAGRGELKEFNDKLPSRNSDIEGVDEQWQLDIRPLPSYVRWGDVICTTKAVIIADRLSGEILIAEVIPGKRADNDEEVWSLEYTAQMIRELIVIAIRKAKRRPRTFYADNGPQFKAKTLEPYMPYLNSPGKAFTKWVNRTATVARGGGFIEDLLGDIDRYLQKFEGTYKSGENFWHVSKRINDNMNLLPTWETFAKDFKSHMKYLNTTKEESPDGLSRIERREKGPDYSLPAPSDMNLLVFARTVERIPVKVQHYGFDYNKKKWEPERDTEEVRHAWHKAALSTGKREILVAKIGKEVLVYIDLEGYGVNWEPAIIKGKPRNTKREDKQLNEAAKSRSFRGNQADSEALDELLLSTLGKPLVISPNGTKLIPTPESDNSNAPEEVSRESDDPESQAEQTEQNANAQSVQQTEQGLQAAMSEADNALAVPALSPDEVNATSTGTDNNVSSEDAPSNVQKPNRKKRKGKKASPANQGEGNTTEKGGVTPPDELQDEDFWSDF